MLLDELRRENLPSESVLFEEPSRRRPIGTLRSYRNLRSTLRRLSLSLVHVNDAPFYRLPGWTAGRLAIPRLVHVRYTYDAEGLRWWLKAGFEYALFASRWMAEWAAEQCPELLPRARTRVVRNGYDPPAMPSPEELKSIRTALDLPPNACVIAFVGQLIPVKGVEEFLRAAQVIRKRHPRTAFILVGDDFQAGSSFRCEMELLTTELGLESAARFTGFQRRPWPYYALSDLVVMPSRVEPLGNVAIEAGAAGRPVIASRVGGIPEIVVDRETGLLIEPGDYEAIADATCELLDSPDLRKRLGTAAAQRIRSDFTLKRQLEQLEAVYEEAIQGS